MIIDEKIQEVKNELVKVLTEQNGSREYLFQKLEKIGLNRVMISKLIESFIQAENAKNAVKNVWGSDTRIDSSTDVAIYQEQESETRQRFEDIIEASSILIVLNKTNVNDVNEDLWQKLYAQGIDYRQITSPILSKNYKEYVEKEERENNPETLKGILSRVVKQVIQYRKRCIELEKENERLKKENEELKRSNKYIETKFKTRIVSDEKNYQAALAQIKTLKRELIKSQNRSIFQTIGAKLFGIRRKELPEPTAEIPNTLYESIVEEVEAKNYKIDVETNRIVTKSEKTNNGEEVEI